MHPEALVDTLQAMLVRTVQLSTSFLHAVPADAGDVTVTGRVLRAGKTLAYGDIALHAPDGKLAAHATTTYALL